MKANALFNSSRISIKLYFEGGKRTALQQWGIVKDHWNREREEREKKSLQQKTANWYNV